LILLTFNKLLFLERFYRIYSHSTQGNGGIKEMDTVFGFFTGIWFSGYLISIFLQCVYIIKFYSIAQDKKQHTSFKKCPGLMLFLKLVLWVIPFRLLDIFDISFLLFCGNGFVNIEHNDQGIIRNYFNINYNNEIYHPMYACFIPFFVTYVMFLGKVDNNNSTIPPRFNITDDQLDIAILVWIIVFPLWNLIKQSVRKF